MTDETNQKTADTGPSALSDLLGGANAWLCDGRGETDWPGVTLARTREAVRDFIVSEWLGDKDDPELQLIMSEFDAHDWQDGPLVWKFEIGSVRIEAVCDVTPNAVLTRERTP